jgi:ABC-2 type transport system ATP-binding protein
MGRALGCALAALAVWALAAGSAAAAPFTVQTLHFDTVVGPRDDRHCDVVGDLYRPKSATRRHRAPAILTTNGFGGSKNDQAGIAKAAAARGYVVLSYSGLGFGGSGCRITLDQPDWDGKAASQLITFLGGGSAAKDGTKVNYVKRDRRGSDGRRHRFDPRIGMVGGSYGGGIQFATAAVDPRLDTIVPLITWNDLSYSLTPNSTDLQSGVTSATAGVPKWIWATLFFAIGELRGLQFLAEDISRITGGCPNFDPEVCPAFVKNAAINTPDRQTFDLLHGASVASFINRIKIPTLLGQGQADTLFNLNESVATYEALRERGVPVKLIWHSWGHSGSRPAPGEWGGDEPLETYEGGIILRWFEHYLRGRGQRPALDFCYFRDWVDYGAAARARRAYACTDRYPAGKRRSYYLSGGDSLVPSRPAVASGSSTFLAPPEVPTSFTEVSAVFPNLPLIDVPGTATSFDSDPLARPLQVAGIPKVRVSVDSALQGVTGVLDEPGATVLFFKLFDVAPDGDLTLVHRLIAPVRIPVTDEPLEVELPGIVHRFEAGHSLRLTVAGSDLAYRGNIAPQIVTIESDPARPGVLSLPVVGDGR